MADDYLDLDLRNYRSNRSAMVPPGRYEVEVSHSEKRTSGANNPQLVSWLKITSGEWKGSILVDYATVTERALFRVVNFLNAVGVKTPNSQLRINPSTIIGKRLLIDVIEDEYKGAKQSKVNDYLPLPRGAQAADPTPAVTAETPQEGLAEFAAPVPNGADPVAVAAAEPAGETVTPAAVATANGVTGVVPVDDL